MTIEATEELVNSANVTEEVKTTENSESKDVVPEIISDNSKEISEHSKESTNIDQPKNEEIFDWKKDKRFGKMWKNENDLYKSYIEFEKREASHYNPIKNKYDNLMKLFSENGIETEKINDYIQEYKSFKNPDNPLVARANYLGKWIENPLYRDKIVAVFEDLENQELQRLYPNMSAEARAKMIEMESKLSEYDKRFQAAEQEKLIGTYSKEINEGLEKCKQLAEKNGFGFPDNIQNQLLQYCESKQIPPKYIYYTFRELYDEQLNKSLHEKTEKNVLEKLNKNKNAGIVNAGSNKKESPKGMSFRDKLLSKL